MLMKFIKIFFFKPFYRNVIRGFINLNQKPNKYFIEKLVSKISKSKFGKDIRIHFFNEPNKIHELALKQKYITHFFSTMSLFNVFLLSSIGKKRKLVFPLPQEIINILQKENIKINEFKSFLFWKLLLLFIFIKSILKFISYFFSSFYYIFCKKFFFYKLQKEKKLDTFFYLLPLNAISKNKKNKFNFFNWYLSYKKLKIKDVALNKQIYKNKKLVKNKIKKIELFAKIQTFRSLLKFSINSIILIYKNFFELFSKKWANLYLSSEIIDYLYSIEIPATEIAKNYVFTNSTIFYKPLWTYAFEKKNSKIILVFYSSHTFNINEIKFKYSYLWSLATWNNYIFFDEHQKNFYKKISKVKFNYELCGIVPHCDNNFIVKKKYDVCIFDITPPRKYYYAKQILLDDFFTEEMVIKFIEDCCQVFESYNYKISIKTKRINQLMTSKKYLNFLKNLPNKFKNVEIIMTDVSPIKLIKKSLIVVTFPFSTPAVIGKMMNKKSIFYYPKNSNHNISDLNRDIEYIYTKKMLEDWAKKNFHHAKY